MVVPIFRTPKGIVLLKWQSTQPPGGALPLTDNRRDHSSEVNQERKGGTERSYRLDGLLVADDWLTLLNFSPFHLCPKVLLQIIRHRVCALLEVFRPCF